MTRILVADDSETILLLMRTRLEMAGYEVRPRSTARRSSSCIGARTRDGPDLLLLDAMMPRKSGIDVLRELRAAGIETPVLIVSAHRTADDADARADLEISGYLTKPIDFDAAARRDRRADREERRLAARAARESGSSRRTAGRLAVCDPDPAPPQCPLHAARRRLRPGPGGRLGRRGAARRSADAARGRDVPRRRRPAARAEPPRRARTARPGRSRNLRGGSLHPRLAGLRPVPLGERVRRPLRRHPGAGGDGPRRAAGPRPGGRPGLRQQPLAAGRSDRGGSRSRLRHHPRTVPHRRRQGRLRQHQRP